MMSKIALVLLTVFLSGCALQGTSKTGLSMSGQEEDASPTPYGAVLLDPVTINLTEQSKSGQTGTVLFQDYGDKTRVIVTLSGGSNNVSQPAHIHKGSCPNPGDIAYGLNNVVAGNSDTIIGVSMSSLFLDPMAVNIHKSSDEAMVYTSCGNLK